MGPEDRKILNEDAMDLMSQMMNTLRIYNNESSFCFKDKALLLALSNLVGNFFNGYTNENSKDYALDIFIEVVTQLLQKETYE